MSHRHYCDFAGHNWQCGEHCHCICGLPMEGRTLGRAPLSVDRNALVRDRLAGMSLTDVAKKYRISRASVVRVVRDAKQSQLVAAA